VAEIIGVVVPLQGWWRRNCVLQIRKWSVVFAYWSMRCDWRWWRNWQRIGGGRGGTF
jgi:hypothetical protein